jgi:DNA polymerase-3 subunit beta
MKVEAAKDEFLRTVLMTEKIAGKNLSLPVLQCVLLSAKKGALSMCATNLELGVETSIPAKVAEEGDVAVPGNVLSSVVGASVGSVVRLSLEGGALAVESADGTTRIRTQAADEFPTLPKVTTGTEAQLSAESLVQALKAVSYSASLSTIKPELASVYLFPEGNTLVAVATDSFRLAEKKIVLKKPVDIPPVLLPIRVVQDLVRVLESADGDILLRTSEHQIAIAFGSTYLTSRLTEGTFPDYKQIIPKEFVAEAVALKADLAQVLRKATIFSDKFNQITFHFDPKKKHVSIHAENADVGETTDGVLASVTGQPIEISFNQRYIADCLGAIASDSVTLSCAGPARPMVMRGVGDSTFFYLVMSMNK